MVVDNLAQPLKRSKYRVFVQSIVLRCIGLGDLQQPGIRREHIRNIVNPSDILANGWISHLEGFGLRVKSDTDTDCLVILIEHFTAEQRRHERRHALLAIDQDALACGRGAVFELDRGVTPGDQVADWISLVERVQQVANLGGLPHERTLDFGDGDLA